MHLLIVNLLIILRQKTDNAQALLYQKAKNAEERKLIWENFHKLLDYLFTLETLYFDESQEYRQRWQNAHGNLPSPEMTVNDKFQLVQELNQKKENIYMENQKVILDNIVKDLYNILIIPPMAAPAAGGALCKNKKTKQKSNKSRQRVKTHNTIKKRRTNHAKRR
jgi:hypothetical protein